MNQKEAENIAWELYLVDECVRNVSGRDGDRDVANTALDSMWNIIENNPKIKIEFENWKSTEDM